MTPTVLPGPFALTEPKPERKRPAKAKAKTDTGVKGSRGSRGAEAKAGKPKPATTKAAITLVDTQRNFAACYSRALTHGDVFVTFLGESSRLHKLEAEDDILYAPGSGFGNLHNDTDLAPLTVYFGAECLALSGKHDMPDAAYIRKVREAWAGESSDTLTVLLREYEVNVAVIREILQSRIS